MPFPQSITIGKCIYCGAARDLTAEHIVPLALNGDFVLQEASCRKCAGITSAFENTLLHYSMVRARAVLGLRTRRKARRPKIAPMTLDRGDGPVSLEIDLNDYPAMILLPILDPPRLGNAPSSFRIGGVHTLVLRSFHEVIPKLGTSAVLVEPFKPLEFSRLLAKVGYGFAIAKFGLSTLTEVFVVKSILGDVDDLCNWVGEVGGPLVNANPNNLHSITVNREEGQVVVYVRLFAMFGGPEYKVVVGRHISSTSNA
jgi:hypothetical protein